MPKLDYPVLIEPLSAKDGGGFVATVPDLPGCMSDGETPEQALTEVQDAIPLGSMRRESWDALFPILRAVTSRQNRRSRLGRRSPRASSAVESVEDVE